MKINVSFEDATLSEVADYLREVVDINVLIGRDVDADTEINFTVKDITVRAFLGYILRANDLGMKIEDGILRIVTAEEAEADVKLAVYDVQDVVMPLRDMPGREITFGDDGIQFVDQPAEVSPDMGDFLVELLRSFTGERAWENSEADIFYQNGLLIVRQTPEIHRKLEKLITMIRRLN
jgi:hypothetical protein